MAINQKNLNQEIATIQNFENIASYWNLLPDPDPILRKIGKDITVYRELLTDSHVWSTIQQRKSGVLSLLWELQQLNSSENEFQNINDFLNNINLENLINQILNTPLFGFTVFEIVWEKQGNFVLPVKIEEKPQEWFFFDKNNQLNIKKNSNSIIQEGEVVNPLKFVLCQYYPTYKNPYGERALSRCFWPVTFKRGGIKFWLTFIEKYGMPYTIGKLPRGSSKDDIDNLLNQLSNMIQDAVAVIPDDSSVEITESAKTTSTEVYNTFLNFMNNEISKAILTQTLTTEIQDRGTYAASKTMSEMLTNIQMADKRLVERTINQIINLIYEINFNNKNKPNFILYSPEDVDKTLAERDEILTKTGVRFTKNYYIRNYNLLPDDFDLQQQTNFSESNRSLSASKKVTEASWLRKSNLNHEALHFNDSISTLGSQQLSNSALIFELLNGLPDQLLHTQIETFLMPIIKLIQNNESYEVVMENLAKTFPDLNSNQLEDLLTRLIFVAQIIGLQ